MQATFYKNNNDERYLTKSLTTMHSNVDVEILDETSIVHPTLKLSSGLADSNYVYVEGLNRYYFIRNITMANGYTYCECDVDVLMSYKSQIKAQYVIVARQQYNYNLYQVDEKMNCYNTPVYRVLNFTGGFSKTGHLVLCVAGAATGGV